MAANYGSKPQTEIGRKGVPPVIVAAAVVALLAFVSWMGYRSFGPQPQAPPNAAAQKVNDEIDALAKKCGGDITKLSAEDQARANALTAGNAKTVLKNSVNP